jgi:O-succinylbenzoic acid--CoA ligase
MTETGSGVVYDGQPLDGVEVRVDQEGQLLLRGPMLLRAYRDGSDPKDGDGWFATGDLGALRDGRVTVHGRRGDLIITGGENVWPDAVEQVLRAHPGVAEVVVIGEPDPEWGRRVVAVAVPTDPAAPPTAATLREHAGRSLPDYAVPKEVRFVASLPRTATGKVRRGDLSPRAGVAPPRRASHRRRR